MKSILSGLLLVLLALSLSVSCGGGDNPLSSDNDAAEFGGTLTMGGNGVNAAVSEMNKQALSQSVLDQIYAGYARAFRAIVTGDAAEGEPFRAVGGYYGNADTEGFDELNQNGSGGYDYSFELTFHDYSNSGSVFLGGKLKFGGSMRRVGENWIPGDVFVDKSLAFAGNFRGSALFEDLLVPMDSSGRFISVTASAQELVGHPYNGQMVLRSGEVSLRFNPFYREQRPSDGQGQGGN